MKLPHWFAFLHKWLGLFIGIQIILWMTGGFIMSFLDLDVVHGDHNVAEQEPLALDGSLLRVPLQNAIAAYAPLGVRSATYKTLLGQSVYDLQLMDGTHVLVDTRSGGRVDIGEAQVRGVASADFSGDGSIIELGLIDAKNFEYQGAVPVWRVAFSDPEGTRLYIHTETGRIVAHRNGSFRLFEFFWRLHIMDWDDGQDFNTWWLVTTSLLALVICLMGYGLMFYRLRFKDWRVMFARKR